MKRPLTIISLLLGLTACVPQISSSQDTRWIGFDFYGESVNIRVNNSFLISYDNPLSAVSISDFYTRISASDYQPILTELLRHREQNKLDDWLYYQLIRKTAQQFSPKEENYNRYTLYKWFLLTKSGYNTQLTISADKMLFYVQSDEPVYNIPYRMKDGKQFACLNYHDYGNNIDFQRNRFTEVITGIEEGHRSFTYKITRLPDFPEGEYTEKDLSFNYYQQDYHFRIRVNNDVKKIFTNYPVVDYSSYFNIPLSQETYASLIPELRKNINGMKTKEGVDFLMRFTRYAFLFRPDTEAFGSEKRLSPEQTLLFSESDCDDRAALFFYLVKEIYDLPMIVLSYPKHVTVAVQFDKPVGNTIEYNGKKYSVCEPTPQRSDLKMGRLLPELKHATYEVAYEYNPNKATVKD